MRNFPFCAIHSCYYADIQCPHCPPLAPTPSTTLPMPLECWGVAVIKKTGEVTLWAEVFRSREEAGMHVNSSKAFSPAPYPKLAVVPVRVSSLQRVFVRAGEANP